ncbi:MAG: cupredoxin family copper-binding protein [Chloroflexi bacterium]|nr:cupredoxin family copper-binding protein [Chloroflexota bacterium]
MASEPMPANSGHMMPAGQSMTTAPMGASMQQPGQAADIKQFAFAPKQLEVPVGTTVTWTNQDAIQHSVTASDGSFDSGLFTQGGTYAHTFDAPGAYTYVCSRHGSMMGTVVVTG